MEAPTKLFENGYNEDELKGWITVSSFQQRVLMEKFGWGEAVYELESGKIPFKSRAAVKRFAEEEWKTRFPDENMKLCYGETWWEYLHPGGSCPCDCYCARRYIVYVKDGESLREALQRECEKKVKEKVWRDYELVYEGTTYRDVAISLQNGWNRFVPLLLREVDGFVYAKPWTPFTEKPDLPWRDHKKRDVVMERVVFYFEGKKWQSVLYRDLKAKTDAEYGDPFWYVERHQETQD